LVALSAGHGRVDDHPVSEFDFLDLPPDFFDFGDTFVPDDKRKLHFIGPDSARGIILEIRTADPNS
jgi:hypothetical protein